MAGTQTNSSGPRQPAFADPAAVELALGAMGVGVFEYDPVDGAYLVSERCREILGLGADEVLSVERVLELLHPDDRAMTLVACDSLKPESAGHYSIEPRVIRADGTMRWVQISGRTVFQECAAGRHPLRSYGTMVDVTERRQMERRLYERESQLSTFIDGAPASIAMFDREMRYLEASRQHAQEIGFAPTDLIGRCAYEVFPFMPERWKAAHARCLNGASERCDMDAAVVRSNGSTDCFRWEIRPWYRADRTVGGLILFSELITHSLQAQRRLHESEARLELAVRAGALGIYDYNLTENTTTWDCRVRQLWGISSDETVTFETFKGGLHPDDREQTLKLLEESLGPDSNGTHSAEYRVVHRLDGSTRWISSTGTVFFEGGRAVRLVGIVQDITDRKRSELALAQSAEELRLADERKDAFLATLSHELRNPLAPIRNAAHILAFKNLKDEQVTWARQVIQRQTTHMASLLNDLLDVARITRGKLVLKKEEVTLAGIVESAVEAARPLLDEKHHGLKLSLPPDTLRCELDPLRMSQVLSNLLGNAAKYTDPQGQIELAAWVENAALFVSVRDNGIGIPPEALDHIFGMFWQVDGARDQYGGGLGIGLAFVKNVVELHGGTIEARSEGPGRGSEFKIKLPLAVRPEPL
jgi:PAS domain S-box-containing protein